MIKAISISGGKPAMLLPLFFVIVVSMIKDVFEDMKRHTSDKRENLKEVQVWSQKEQRFETKLWRELVVGSVIKIFSDDFLPSDVILVKSSEAKGICYIETKNLDGETNLKHKATEKNFEAILAAGESYIPDIKGRLICE